MPDYPARIFAYLADAIGGVEAQRYAPAGIVRRCPSQYRDGGARTSCERLGYWSVTTETDGGRARDWYVVVWDGPTLAKRSAFEYGLVDPDRPYGFDSCVSPRYVHAYFACGWCGSPDAMRMRSTRLPHAL
jgi:hypothetical protein